MVESETRSRTFLFLQGLSSMFFRQLGKALAARGHTVLRINFNAGDWMFWRQPNAFGYRGRPEDWPKYVTEFMAEHRVTDIILFGDCRPLHRVAIAAAAELQVSVHVVEEGYLRPDWVTIERGGVNGHSSLPRNPDWYLEQARNLPPVENIDSIASSFRRRAREDLIYNISTMALWWMHPHYRTHRPWHPIVEYAGWAWRLLRQFDARRRARQHVAQLVDRSCQFLFPLQLDCDSQIRLHSPFKGMHAAIGTVLESFAAHAPAEAVLVVKEHPLDNGLVNWRRFTLAAADRLRIGERIIYLEDGDIAKLVRGAAGVVTVNSTTGTFALDAGVPVITLGNAIYNLQGLTFQDSLDQFWRNPKPPDAALFDAFRRVLVNRCLVRGGFFSDEGLSLLVEGAVGRLEAVSPSPASRGRDVLGGSQTGHDFGMGSATAAALRQ
jgi:capsular polysaccharide export protein